MRGKPETTITGKNRVTLPANSLKDLCWQRGEKLLVRVLGEALVLTRQPTSWADRFSGKMGDVWGDHEDNMRYLDEERARWGASLLEPEADVNV